MNMFILAVLAKYKKLVKIENLVERLFNKQKGTRQGVCICFTYFTNSLDVIALSLIFLMLLFDIIH